MASNRIGRINEEIQRELSSLFRTLKDPRVQGGMVTITHVDTTTDLRYCRVFVSVLDKTQEKDVIRGLKSATRAGHGDEPALHAGAAIYGGRFHRVRRAHSGNAARPDEGQAREPRKRAYCTGR